MAYLHHFFRKKNGPGKFYKANKILAYLSFGTNRGIYVVEIAGKILVVGVTNHSINLLQEITSESDIQKIKDDWEIRNLMEV